MEMNLLMQMVLKRLQTQNPQGYKMVSEAIQNNGNPQAMLQQLMSNSTNEQKQQLFKQAKGYGVPDELLSNLQNMK